GVGKMSPQLEAWCTHNSRGSARNLGTVFFEVFAYPRANTVAMVLPADFLGLAWFRAFRDRLLRDGRIHSLARLGPRAFRTTMFDFLTCLLIYSRGTVEHKDAYFELDLDREDVNTLAHSIRVAPSHLISQ